MPKPTKGPRLGGSSSHQKAMLANLATSLFEHGRIKTTEPKARALRPYAEKLITHAKKGTLHNRREVLKKIRDKDVVHTCSPRSGRSSPTATAATPASSRWRRARATTPRWPSSNWCGRRR